MSRDDLTTGDLEVDVAPDMGMYRILPQQGYNPAFALAEFIDNAIHAFQHNNEALSTKYLSVTLNFFTNEYEKNKNKRNSIEIIDDGPGMLKSELGRAFKPAKKPVIEGLSEFGIGMKAASVWFTDTWELTTKNLLEKEHHSVHFDLNKLFAEGSSKITVEDSQNDSMISNHGTVIKLTDLRSRRQLDKAKTESICNLLSEIYQRFTSLDSSERVLVLKASIDGSHPKPLNYKAHDDNTILVSPINKSVTRQKKSTYYAIGEERSWYKNISFDFSHDGISAKITGFIYILKTGRYDTDNPGLVLFRNGRVVVGTHEKDYKPNKLYGTKNKYRSQRLYGELTIDGLPVTYTKDEIDFDEDAFIEELLRQEPEVSLFCNQCENYRAEKSIEETVFISSEDDIPPPANKPSPKKTRSSGVKKTAKPKVNKGKSQRKTILDYLQSLKESDISNLGLIKFIDELRYQIIADRPVSAALSLRVVIEKGTLARIKKDFNDKYSRVSEFGIQALINHMTNNKSDFFDNQKDVSVFKCVQVNSKSRQFGDVLVLNNIGHGGFNPNSAEIESMIINFQPLLDWAYFRDD
ncbi:ATP-binding protein [Thalassotalea sp. 1_MG-2023]|uniref:ATP-binding protein n=1 Tax=Thalassotalea sp. 1_MG-2023 TaxID=3062680 RepID=UPI0026E31A91|nr:ATP-binding protein [Thalassotalea sp. 1_MG-2023]MDO6426565.1 ATP-binding protein [Thalassotalea sp. 1_MG-2023]